MKAAFIGRFQPLHEGHHRVIEKYREEYDDFLVVVGSASKKREKDNPLSFEERKSMIDTCFDLEVMPLEDQGTSEEGNRGWTNKLEKETNAEVIISGNERVQRLVEEYSSMELIEQELYDPEIYSGTEVRRRIRSGEEWRYLIPGCAKEEIEQKMDVIKESGIQYDFKPGWKKENAYHGTADK